VDNHYLLVLFYILFIIKEKLTLFLNTSKFHECFKEKEGGEERSEERGRKKGMHVDRSE
jgi:hypothetical protein